MVPQVLMKVEDPDRAWRTNVKHTAVHMDMKPDTKTLACNSLIVFICFQFGVYL
jgi:hypothetical protein